MQIVTTDKGEFIDNLPRNQFGYYSVARSGFDWKAKIGQVVDGIKIFEDSGYQWLNKQ